MKIDFLIKHFPQFSLAVCNKIISMLENKDVVSVVSIKDTLNGIKIFSGNIFDEKYWDNYDDYKPIALIYKDDIVNYSINSKIKGEYPYKVAKCYNFDIDVEFEPDMSISIKDKQIIILMIHEIYTTFENYKKYINLKIKPFERYINIEKLIPYINKIMVNRFDNSGEFLGTDIYNHCEFICSESKYSYLSNKNEPDLEENNLEITYKFLYDSSILN